MWLQEYEGAPAVPQTIVKALFLTNTMWYLEDPVDLPLKGIQYIKWMELYDKWRPLVSLEKWREWIYYSTNLQETEGRAKSRRCQS